MDWASFRKIHRRGAYAVGWLLLSLLLIQGSLPGLVLCFGVNGHVAVETPHNVPSYPSSQEEGPCLDFPFISVSSDDRLLRSSREHMPQRLGPLAGATLVPLVVPMPLFPHSLLFPPTPLTTPPAAFLRAIVLRI